MTNIVHPASSQTASNASFYQSAELSNLTDVVRFFHEAWGHKDKQTMLSMVNNGMVTNLPAVLTPSVISRHFPVCPDCSRGNLAQRPVISDPVDREIEEGAEWECDIKTWHGPP